MIKNFCIIFITVFFSTNIKSYEFSNNSLNKKIIDQNKPLTFVILGHLRDGAQWNFPNYRTERFLKKLQNNNLSFIVLLGDTFYEPNKTNILKLKRLLNNLDYPVFQAIGNHETYLYSIQNMNQETNLETLNKFKVNNKNYYIENFGETNNFFIINNNCFFILDFENEVIGLSNKFEEIFFDKIKNCGNNDEIKNIFLFSHKLIWAFNDDYQNVLKNTNSYGDYINKNYKNDQINKIYNTIIEISNDKKVFWISGDSDNYYYYRNKNPFFGVIGNNNLPSDYGLLFEDVGESIFEVSAININNLSKENIIYEDYDIAELDNKSSKMYNNFFSTISISSLKLIIKYNIKYLFLYAILITLFFVILLFILIKRK